MPKSKKKVSHMKTGLAEVRLHFKGKRILLTVVLPADLERRLARRLRSPKRFPDA
jgi:hypothetical protein